MGRRRQNPTANFFLYDLFVSINKNSFASSIYLPTHGRRRKKEENTNIQWKKYQSALLILFPTLLNNQIGSSTHRTKRKERKNFKCVQQNFSFGILCEEGGRKYRFMCVCIRDMCSQSHHHEFHSFSILWAPITMHPLLRKRVLCSHSACLRYSFSYYQFHVFKIFLNPHFQLLHRLFFSFSSLSPTFFSALRRRGMQGYKLIFFYIFL